MFMRLVSVIRMQPESEPTSAVPRPSETTRFARSEAWRDEDDLDMLHRFTDTVGRTLSAAAGAKLMAVAYSAATAAGSAAFPSPSRGSRMLGSRSAQISPITIIPDAVRKSGTNASE